MSQEQATNDSASSSSDPSPNETVSGAESLDDLHELLGELRAEVTRLKAQQAKQQAKSWTQRRPVLSLALSSVVGAAAGYGLAYATRTQPSTLSEKARRRIRELAEEARRVASDVGRDLSDRAARSSEEVRARAEKTGRRLAEQAQKHGGVARKEAQEWARRATEQARKAGSEAGERLRRASEEASKEARELGESLSKEAGKAVENQAETVREAVSSSDSSRARNSLLTIAGLAAGGLLASQVRRWF